jgi:ADP-ribosylglycohydrolase
MQDINRIHGALFGVAYGDALGMPAEFWSRRKIKEYFGRVSTFLPAPAENEITHGLKAGEVTDDTWMTLIIADALTENRGQIDPHDLVKRITGWVESNRNKSAALLGPSTKKAFELILNGAPIEEAGKNGATNGSAMRIVPVGIVSDWRDLGTLVNNVRLACLPTHNTSHAIGAASAIAAAVSCAVHGAPGDIKVVIDAAKEACIKGGQLGYESIGPSLLRKIETAIRISEDADGDELLLDEIYEVVGTGLPAFEAVPAALALVNRAKGDPVKCGKLTANCGGDTDTIGAMACGICGAFSGIEAFPEDAIKLISRVNNVDFRAAAINLAGVKS